MSLANPALLAGLLAAVVPVLVHLIRRMERRGEAFPSLMFIEKLPFPDRRPRTLRDRALLALRCLAVLLLALAFAGPRCAQETPPAAVSESASAATVLLIDRSYSMSSAARWQAVMDEAGQRIDARAGDERLAIVTFDDTAKVVVPLTDDASELRARLDELSAGTGGTRLAGAIDLAGRMLRDAGASEQRLVLVSDLQASAVAEVDRIFLDRNVTFEIAAVTPPVPANAAVLSADLERRNDGAASEEMLTVRLRNTGAEAMTDVNVATEIAGRITDRRRVDLAAGEERTLRVPVVLSLDRASPARVILGDDALTADNEHHLVLIPDSPIEVALALTENSPPETTPPAVFLRQALSVLSTPPVRISEPSTRTGDLSSLANVDVLVADDATMASNDVRRRVAGFVASGGGLLTLLTDTTEAGLSSSDLAPALGEPQRHPAPGLGVVLPSETGKPSVWQAADGDIAAALANTRLLMSRPVRVPRRDDGTRVLARLIDGSPWLVERNHGSGRSVLMASGVTRPWGNLAVEPGFVPLLQELLRHLARHEPTPVARTLGDVIDIERLAAATPGATEWRDYLAAGGAVVVERPVGSAQRLNNGKALYRSRDAGPHAAHRADGQPPALPFAVNVDRRESLLAAASPDDLTTRIQRRAQAQRPEPQNLVETAARDTTPLGWYLLAAVLFLLWLESRIANRLSWRRATAGGSG